MTLRVRLEIVPHGDEAATREIGRLDIFNVGHVDFGHCEYRVKDGDTLHDESVVHRRDLGAWALLAKVLKDLEITGP